MIITFAFDMILNVSTFLEAKQSSPYLSFTHSYSHGKSFCLPYTIKDNGYRTFIVI